MILIGFELEMLSAYFLHKASIPNQANMILLRWTPNHIQQGQTFLSKAMVSDFYFQISNKEIYKNNVSSEYEIESLNKLKEKTFFLW